jgi:hypothetical protein
MTEVTITIHFQSGSKAKKLDKNVPLYSLLAVYRMYLPFAELSPLYSKQNPPSRLGGVALTK